VGTVAAAAAASAAASAFFFSASFSAWLSSRPFSSFSLRSLYLRVQVQKHRWRRCGHAQARPVGPIGLFKPGPSGPWACSSLARRAHGPVQARPVGPMGLLEPNPSGPWACSSPTRRAHGPGQARRAPAARRAWLAFTCSHALHGRSGAAG
jgi:hypothetical protein